MAYHNTDELITQLNHAPEQVEFNDVIALIDSTFAFTPTEFTNGQVNNPANQNNGSCKLLSLAQYLKLSKEHTLALFGSFYRVDVLQHPDGTDHANIRNFMLTGHGGVSFKVFPLALKA
ncbi:HopJ type III effector protein [Shewanella sp. A25]|nr:HopJ type III effector protein [Shewanella shenzhenensis]